MLKKNNIEKRSKKITKCRYAWSGTSFKDFLAKNSVALKYSSRSKMYREYINRAQAYAELLTNLESISHIFQAIYSDDFSDNLKNKSVLVRLVNK